VSRGLRENIALFGDVSEEGVIPRQEPNTQVKRSMSRRSFADTRWSVKYVIDDRLLGLYSELIKTEGNEARPVHGHLSRVEPLVNPIRDGSGLRLLGGRTSHGTDVPRKGQWISRRSESWPHFLLPQLWNIDRRRRSFLRELRDQDGAAVEVRDDAAARTRQSAVVAPTFTEAARARGRKQLLAYAGALILAIGAFCPVESFGIPGIMNYSVKYLDYGSGHAVYVLILAVVAAGLAFFRRYRFLWLASGIALALTIYDLVQLANLIHLANLTAGPIFTDFVRIEWGWGVLFLGECLLIGVPFIREGQAPKRGVA
jgi:hypothetical protein